MLNETRLTVFGTNGLILASARGRVGEVKNNVIARFYGNQDMEENYVSPYRERNYISATLKVAIQKK